MNDVTAYLARKWEQAQWEPDQRYWEARLHRHLQRMAVEPLVDGGLVPLPRYGGPFRARWQRG